MSISAKELAAKIHLSPATVSMVFNNRSGVSEATKRLVLEAAKNMTMFRQSLLPWENGRFNWWFTRSTQWWCQIHLFLQVIEGVIQECSEKNGMVNISYLTGSSDVQQQIKNISSMSGEGMILLATEMNRGDFGILREVGIPVIVLDCYYDDLDYDCVVINNSQGRTVPRIILSGWGTEG